MSPAKLQPTWSKLPTAVEDLILTPWRFSLFRALYLIEQNWATPTELNSGISERVLISSNQNLGFAAAEIQSCELHNHDRGVLALTTNFLGLYGADSPMPHYVLEQSAQNSPVGARTRAFLDMFNHVLYCQIYQAWKKSQFNLAGIGANQYDQMLDAILSGADERIYNTGLASVKQNSASGLTQLLRIELQEPTIKVNDLGITWMPLDELSTMGSDETTVLGMTTILGSEVLVSGANIKLDIGPVSSDKAKRFSPHEKEGARLAELVQSHLPEGVPWQCEISINEPGATAKLIGVHEIGLGIGSHLGEMKAKMRTQNFSSAQYQRSIAKI